MFQKTLVCIAIAISSITSFAGTFEISIRNTSARSGFGGQNISGPALIIHRDTYQFFQPGHAASRALWEIAEEGDTTAALALSESQPEVVSTHKLTRIPRTQTNPSTNRFSVEPNSENIRFSLAGMMTSTNDGFAGVNSERLPQRINEKLVFDLRAWDAGSEENNEMCPYVPCADHYIRMPFGAEGQIAPHSGIRGGADLDRVARGWPSNNIVGRVEVTRIN